jgi:hypothetical protein
MLKTAVALGSVIASLFVPSSAAQASAVARPPASEVVIEVTGVNGSGCPDGTATVEVSPGNEAFTVTYSEFHPAWVGAGAKPVDFRKNCQVSLRVHAPEGFTYALAQADHGGFAHLKSGATAVQATSFYFQGSAETTSRSESFSGPSSDYWQTSYRIGYGDLVWHTCDGSRDLNINTSVRVGPITSEPKSTSFIAVGSPVSRRISAEFHLAWKWC